MRVDWGANWFTPSLKDTDNKNLVKKLKNFSECYKSCYCWDMQQALISVAKYIEERKM